MDYTKARENMVLNQMKPCGVVDDAVLNAFLAVERHMFFDESVRSISYSDAEMKFLDRKLFTPTCLGLIVQSSEPKEGDSVLYLGAANGYGSAIFSNFGCIVNAVENVDRALRVCADNLSEYDEIRVSQYPLFSKYEIIFIEACINIETLHSYQDLLSDNGTIVGILEDSGLSYAFIASLNNGKISIVRTFDILFDFKASFHISPR